MEFDNLFTVYFEIGGKKMKMDVYAKDKAEAKRKVADKIIFHKVDKPKDGYNQIIDRGKDLMDALGIK